MILYAWVYCPARTPPESYKHVCEYPPGRCPSELPLPATNMDEGYDARRINWPRLWERVMASVINAIFYGTLLVVAKALGLL